MTKNKDQDYSPEIQDEYQRLWHRDAAALKIERERTEIMKHALEEILHLKYTATLQDALTIAARALALDEK